MTEDQIQELERKIGEVSITVCRFISDLVITRGVSLEAAIYGLAATLKLICDAAGIDVNMVIEDIASVKLLEGRSGIDESN